MKKAVFLTTYNRLPYLQQVLESWSHVRASEDWDLVAMIEPSPIAGQIVEEFDEFKRANQHLFRGVEVHVNPRVYGVLHHPWVGFERLLSMKNYDFVVRAEDDLVVSDDILEFFNFASEHYYETEDIATVHAFSTDSGDPASVVESQFFSPWLWGTWRNRWQNLIGPTWDHDYSTFNEFSGNQSGWDWNLNTRIFPKLDLRSARPLVSRANNIGVHGIHGTPDNFVQSESFQAHRPAVTFHADSRQHD